ncbi:MAG: ribbon-helix-helix protein, CopG family [Bryobacterales bacterium]|nr:ribbon-helix-helix protein, CopG family [Bryobacterales bacterium]
MATTKVTFTFDPATIARLNDAAQRLAKPKSEIVREAIHEYHQHIGRLSESEKQRMLRALDEFAKLPPTRTQAEVDAELKEIRRARRHGGRRHRYD